MNSYDGDSKVFSFEWPVFDGYYEDILFLDSLRFTIKLITVEEGIHTAFTDFSTRVQYEWKKMNVHIKDFEREWKLHLEPTDPADIKLIDKKHMTIDLKEVIREEIIMSIMSSHL